jgi:hypothetical protein
LSAPSPAPSPREPVPEGARARLRGARAGTAGKPQPPEPLTVRHRISVRGTIMIGGQRAHVGLPHAEVTIETDTYQITVEDAIALSAPRKISREIQLHKASNYDPPGSRSQQEL